MSKNSMRPNGLRMEAKVKDETQEVEQIRVVFTKDGREFAVKMDLGMLKAFTEAAMGVLEKSEPSYKPVEKKIPGYA